MIAQTNYDAAADNATVRARQAAFAEVMTFPAPRGRRAGNVTSLLDFVFAEVW